jgi:hypothetical protein
MGEDDSWAVDDSVLYDYCDCNQYNEDEMVILEYDCIPGQIVICPNCQSQYVVKQMGEDLYELDVV